MVPAQHVPLRDVDYGRVKGSQQGSRNKQGSLRGTPVTPARHKITCSPGSYDNTFNDLAFDQMINKTLFSFTLNTGLQINIPYNGSLFLPKTKLLSSNEMTFSFFLHLTGIWILQIKIVLHTAKVAHVSCFRLKIVSQIFFHLLNWVLFVLFKSPRSIWHLILLVL